MESPKGGKQSPFVQTSKSPVNKSSSSFPKKGALPEALNMESTKGEKQSPFVQLSKSPVNKSSSRFSKKGASMRRAAIELLLLSKFRVDESFSRFPRSGALCRDALLQRNILQGPREGTPCFRIKLQEKSERTHISCSTLFQNSCRF
jgi:hypothetical protein